MRALLGSMSRFNYLRTRYRISIRSVSRDLPGTAVPRQWYCRYSDLIVTYSRCRLLRKLCCLKTIVRAARLKCPTYLRNSIFIVTICDLLVTDVLLLTGGQRQPQASVASVYPVMERQSGRRQPDCF